MEQIICFLFFFAHLFVPLTFGRKYYRSRNQRKINFPLVFCSLNRTFARKSNHEVRC